VLSTIPHNGRRPARRFRLTWTGGRALAPLPPLGEPPRRARDSRSHRKHSLSGQPTEPQLADIHALDVRHIINLGLHSHEKALPDEAASVSRLGMTYIHIPVDFQKPTDGDFDQFCSAMEYWHQP